jgi:hypothetical protein
MPTERDKIEAELRMTESERLALKLHESIGDLDEMEAELAKLEEQAGLPSFYRTKPVTERLAAVGIGKETIDRIGKPSEALDAVRNGTELPDFAKTLLAEQADAELSAVDQLAAIMESRRKP